MSLLSSTLIIERRYAPTLQCTSVPTIKHTHVYILNQTFAGSLIQMYVRMYEIWFIFIEGGSGWQWLA